MINEKGIKHILLSALLIVLLTIVSVPKKVKATGFPVVDLASVVQMLVDLGQQIAQHGEMITTAVNSGLSVVEQIKEYEQMLTEYETTLKNLTDLSGAISDGDFNAAYKLLSNSNLTDFVNEDLLDFSGEMLDVWVAVDDTRRGRLGGARAIEEILEEMADIYPDDEIIIEHIEIAQNRQASTTTSAAISQAHLESLDGYEEFLVNQEEIISGLGEESELQTLQALAQTLIFQSRMNLSQMKHDAARGATDVSMSEIYSRNMAQSIDRNLVSARQALDTDVIYTLDD